MSEIPNGPKQPKDKREQQMAIQRLYVLKLEKIIRHMWPMWVSAVDWAEHNNHKALNAMREEYYSPTTSLRPEEYDLLISVASQKP